MYKSHQNVGDAAHKYRVVQKTVRKTIKGTGSDISTQSSTVSIISSLGTKTVERTSGFRGKSSTESMAPGSRDCTTTETPSGQWHCESGATGTLVVITVGDDGGGNRVDSSVQYVLTTGDMGIQDGFQGSTYQGLREVRKSRWEMTQLVTWIQVSLSTKQGPKACLVCAENTGVPPLLPECCVSVADIRAGRSRCEVAQ